jgi:hypothetical protein
MREKTHLLAIKNALLSHKNGICTFMRCRHLTYDPWIWLKVTSMASTASNRKSARLMAASCSVSFLMKWGCWSHWGHRGHWGCWGHWGRLGSWCQKNHWICRVQVFTLRKKGINKPKTLEKKFESIFTLCTFKLSFAYIFCTHSGLRLWRTGMLFLTKSKCYI